MGNELIRFVEKLGRPRIGVIGDLMLDRYVWGDVERISPEAPIPVLRVSRREVRVGGAGSVAVNLARLGVDVRVFSLVGGDEHGTRVRSILADEGCRVDSVLDDASRRTTVKTRNMGYVQQSHRAVQQMLRVDDEDLAPVSEEQVARLLESVSEHAGELDALLISDYHKGLVQAELVAGALDAMAGRPILVDPARVSDYSPYRGATLICPNRFEAELASGLPCRTLEECGAVGRHLVRDLDLGAVAVTLDREGIFLFCSDGESRHFPTRVRVVADVTGAGDMVLTILGVVAAAGGTLDRAVELANVAAGLEVRHFGVTPISREELLGELRFQGHPVVGKIKSAGELARVVETIRESGRTVVFTNGCFDLLHLGHHHLLNGASREGDVLVVAVNSDESIRRLKGPSRPRIAQEDRVKMLAGMEAVDYVVVFDEDTPNTLLETLRPDVLVKGSEYSGDEDGVVGREIVEGYGGRVAFVEQLPGFSTTALLGEDAGDE